MVLCEKMENLKIEEEDLLTRRIKRFVELNAQDKNYLVKKLSIIDDLEIAVQEVIGDDCEIELIPFGEGSCCLGLRGSALEVSLRWPGVTKNRGFYLKNVAVGLLKKKKELQIRVIFIDHGSNPRITIEMYNEEIEEFMDVVVNVNEYKNIYKTRLLKAYTKCDARFVPLSLVIRRWAEKQGIMEGREGLNSISLSLMLVAYLQSEEIPRVFPKLQKLFPDQFGTPTSRPPLEDILRENPSFRVARSKNTSSLGELLRGFFNFYAKLDFRWNIITVTDGIYGKKMWGPNPPWCGKQRALCIRDPLVRTQATAKRVDDVSLEKIEAAFEGANAVMLKGSSLLALVGKQ